MLQLQVECLREKAEELSEFFEETGAVSVTFTDNHDDPIFEPELGTTPLWPHVFVEALYENEIGAEDALQQLRSFYPDLKGCITPLPDQDWERVWMENYAPMQFGERLWICPSWLTPPDPKACNLILDPGLAFGTGTHPTTSLCLSWLAHASLNNQTLIDYGCGSGILALAAIQLGAEHVFAVDLDEQALYATKNNASSNEITDKSLTVSLPDALQEATDILLANILLSPLIALKNRFHQLLKAKGTLVASGVLKEQTQELINAYQGLFEHQTTEIQGDWARLVFQKIER